jgi:hypothetical protein
MIPLTDPPAAATARVPGAGPDPVIVVHVVLRRPHQLSSLRLHVVEERQRQNGNLGTSACRSDTQQLSLRACVELVPSPWHSPRPNVQVDANACGFGVNGWYQQSCVAIEGNVTREPMSAITGPPQDSHRRRKTEGDVASSVSGPPVTWQTPGASHVLVFSQGHANSPCRSQRKAEARHDESSTEWGTANLDLVWGEEDAGDKRST